MNIYVEKNVNFDEVMKFFISVVYYMYDLKCNYWNKCNMLLKDINNMNVDKFRIYGFVILGDFWNIYWNNKKWYEKKMKYLY